MAKYRIFLVDETEHIVEAVDYTQAVLDLGVNPAEIRHSHEICEYGHELQSFVRDLAMSELGIEYQEAEKFGQVFADYISNSDWLSLDRESKIWKKQPKKKKVKQYGFEKREV